MKALFVSDNHGDRAILQKIAARFSNEVDIMLHCGDSNLEPSNPVMQPFKTVIGNTDWGLDYPQSRLAVADQERILVVHGHLYQVNFTLTPLMLLAKEQRATIAAYGHTHQLAVEFNQGTLYLNPGSISQPRGQYQNIGGTLAIVMADSNKLDVQYYDRRMQPINDLHFVFLRQ